MNRTSFWSAFVASLLLVVVPQLTLAAAHQPVHGTHGMIVTSVEPAAAVGQEILLRGGNAIDAAVASGLAAGVAHQFSSGLGGGGFLVVHTAEGKDFAIDARETAPASASPAMYLDEIGVADPKASRYGARAVAIPGLVQGLEETHRRFGKLPWRDVVQPAIRMAREGFAIGPHHRRILKIVEKRLAGYPETARVQLIDGEVPALEAVLKQPDLAKTLQAIAERGSGAMTEGPIAEAIVAASEGVLTLEDLSGYQVVWREPIRGRYRGYEIVSMPPPSSGGVLLVEQLNALEDFDLKSLGHNSSDMIHLVSQAMKLAFADRAAHLGDSDFYPVPVQWLTSRAYGNILASRLRTPPFWKRLPWRWGKPHLLNVSGPTTPPDDSGTTHISVMDAQGNAVSLTQTVNTLFGSLITVPGTGIVLNNEMDDFSASPSGSNSWGAVGRTAANAIAVGKRPLSSMTPTIVLRDGQARMVVGSPMGTIIISAVLQTLINVIDFDMNAQAAVSAPRFHHQWRPDGIMLEPEHPRDVRDRLSEIGHQLIDRRFYLGASQLILRDAETGEFWGGADPRRDSAAAGL
ncbi:MAG: gamma-glutamyltransferase [bacterium]|nr:gamma-glutamyltransferase [bacterium]